MLYLLNSFNIIQYMNFDFLPPLYLSALNFLDVNKLTEIRIRKNCPVTVLYSKKRHYLTEGGTSKNEKKVIAEKCDIDYIIGKVTEHSVYAFNDCIKQGFLTTKNGIRIGLAGECVFENGKIKTIKEFSSLNIRIPHTIIGCSDIIFKYIYSGFNINNSLIVSPPGMGKTTILKDLALKLDETNDFQILIIDERAEFSEIYGNNMDKIIYSDKQYAFSYGLRSLSPNVVITDELSGEEDWNFVKEAVNCGINVIASCHAKDIQEVKNKNFFLPNVFDKYFILSSKERFGKTEAVFDRELNKICEFL